MIVPALKLKPGDRFAAAGGRGVETVVFNRPGARGKRFVRTSYCDHNWPNDHEVELLPVGADPVGAEPVAAGPPVEVVVVRHPDFANEIRVFGAEAVVVDVDLGAMDLSDPGEWKQWLESRVADLESLRSPEARSVVAEAISTAAQEHSHEVEGPFPFAGDANDAALATVLAAAEAAAGPVSHWDVKAELENGLEVAVWFESGAFRMYSVDGGVVTEDTAERLAPDGKPADVAAFEAGADASFEAAPVGPAAGPVPVGTSYRATAEQVLAVMPDEGTVGEAALHALLAERYGWDVETAKRAISAAHIINAIRWVAFDGWAKGGRPQ